ncbi:MAG: hypothetical protein CMM30_09570 [Rhodospirillaceae bacterium]|nr:hypothetical protein [Rhodospirillaceae bacterium]|tara:strand:+ start:4578 stop:5213 length:636 start_codon:yes stop_codon:yes gene_type:complete
MPDITQKFEINQPAEDVWKFLQSVPEVVDCIPGFSLTGQEGDKKYFGKVSIRLGPIVSAFEGEATIVETNIEERTSKIEGQGLDKQGGSRASATVTYTVKEKNDITIVDIYAEMKLTGSLAQMGRTGIVQDVADQLTKEFSVNLNQKLISADSKQTDGIKETTDSGSLGRENFHPKDSVNNSKGTEINATKLLLKILFRKLLSSFGFKNNL